MRKPINIIDCLTHSKSLMPSSIKAGDVIVFKQEWMDEGDEDIIFRAIEDDADGRVLVMAELDLPFNPTHTVQTCMIALVNGKPYYA